MIFANSASELGIAPSPSSSARPFGEIVRSGSSFVRPSGKALVIEPLPLGARAWSSGFIGEDGGREPC